MLDLRNVLAGFRYEPWKRLPVQSQQLEQRLKYVYS